MPMTPKEMIKLLKKHGFIKKSQQGSHAKYYNPHTRRTTMVPMHNIELGKDLENEILKQAGLK